MENNFKGLEIVAIISALSICVLYPIKRIMNWKNTKKRERQNIFRCPRCDSKCVPAYKTLDDKKQSSVQVGFYCKKCNAIRDEKGNEVYSNV